MYVAMCIETSVSHILIQKDKLSVLCTDVSPVGKFCVLNTK
jgi:hypothetical protein